MSFKIIGPVSAPDPGLKVSAWVDYMLEDAKPTDRFWFAAINDIAIGGLKLKLKDGGVTARDITGETVGIDELSVEPKYQRQGVGSALMQAAEKWVTSSPELPQTIGLGVETDNEHAITLYHKLGFVVASNDKQPVTFMGTDGKPCFVMYKHVHAKMTP